MACYVVWADIDSDHHITGPNAKITKWLKGGGQQTHYAQPFEGKDLFCLQGWRKPEAGSKYVPMPTYQDSDFKLLCPVASGHLPLRQEWLELMEAKYTNDTVKLAFNAFVKSHSETYNPSGKPLESADRNRTPSSPNLPSTREDKGTELPLDEHAPTTERELA